MKNKLQQQVVEDFLRWAVILLESDKAGSVGKKMKEKPEERLWALKMICDRAGLTETLERIQAGRIL